MATEWLTGELPPDSGQLDWYWVSDGGTVWPAIRLDDAIGGWSNLDTWEDYDHQVRFWIPIQRPKPPVTIDDDRAAYEAQQARLEAHHRTRPRHPNEDFLEKLAASGRVQNADYWAERNELFGPVYRAIEEWHARFWETETFIPNPDGEDD